jgi:DNA-binding beta-propeller fold protein YncE
VGVASDGRTGHTFVINTAGGSVSMLDTRSGALIHTTALHGVGGPTTVAMAGATGRAFIIDQRTSIDYGSGTAFLSMLDARTGRLLRSVPLGAYTVAAYPGAVSVDERTDRVVAVCGGDATGVAYLLDARTGAIVRAVAGVGTPYAAAVDPGEGRAFLVDAAGAAIVLLDTPRHNCAPDRPIGRALRGEL